MENIIALVAAVEHGQRAAAHQPGEVAAADILQPLHFVAAQRIKHAGGVDASCDGIGGQ